VFFWLSMQVLDRKVISMSQPPQRSQFSSRPAGFTRPASPTPATSRPAAAPGSAPAGGTGPRSNQPAPGSRQGPANRPAGRSFGGGGRPHGKSAPRPASKPAPKPQVDESHQKEEAIELEGTITAVLAGTMFKVKLRNGHEVLAHISGKMRKKWIRLVIGDQVKLEMSPYDMDKARIVYRL
jgi:translation initiation factor IF-1